MKTTLTVILIIQLYGFASCGTKEHYFINLKQSWDDARIYCRKNYHDLSTFTNETEEQKFLQDAGNPSDHAWVGLYRESGIWKWAGGEVATRISWDGQPLNATCAYFSNICFKIHTRQCTENMSFFCMTFEFVMVQQTESWEEALEYCRNHHDDLASLSTNRSMTDAVSKITGAQTQYVWIGLRFLAGEWFWISGDDLQYEVWTDATEAQCPVRNQRCAALNKNTQTWTPRDCQEKLNFLCFSSL